MEKQLYLNSLYILSGPSGSGKTFFMEKLIKNGLPKEAVINPKEIVSLIFGVPPIIDSYSEIKKNGFKNLIKEMIDIRLSQNMTTFIDDNNLNEEIRKEFVDIAKKYGMKYEILIFNEDKNILNKRNKISLGQLNKQIEKFKINSAFNHSLVSSKDSYVLYPNLLDTEKVDVVGDIHGLFDELILCLKKCGWNHFEKENYLQHIDNTRKILFLGDIVDRGKQSIDVLELVKNTCKKGNGFLILGNHEEKLLSSYKKFKEDNVFLYKSMSSALTFFDFFKLPLEKRDELYNFLLECPIKISIWIDKKTGIVTKEENNAFKIGFVHAAIEFFNEKFLPRSLALYGNRYDTITDVDELYQKNVLSGINSHVLLRGHIPNTSQQDYVFSLEDGQAFNGNLVVMSLDKYINILKKNNWQPKFNFFDESVVRYKTEFNFNDYLKEKRMLLNEMNNLVQSELATDGCRKDESGQKKQHEDEFKIYKYSKKVHFKRLWKTNPWIEKARGLVLDKTGNIIVHPFDKLYNFGEYDIGKNVSKDKKVQVIEKVNGFLGCISKHPFKNELLLSTTGSISKDSPFVKFISDFVTPELIGKLLNFFKNNDMTLMFEVIHKDDPHIIEYSESDYGLWLIGARKKELLDKPETEDYLDDIAPKFGFKRPKWEEKAFEKVIESLQTSKIEGFLIRDSENNEPMMKIKTNYYLVTKFVGRMGKNMVKMMFNHSEQFKEEKVDEEFYPIVDKIIAKISENDFNEMPQDKRILFVREIVNETRSAFLNESDIIKENNFKSNDLSSFVKHKI